MIDRRILTFIARGYELIVRAHDPLNPGHGYFARLHNGRDAFEAHEETPADALEALAGML